MRVKICGITNLDDAAEAVRLGAWAVGLIHYDESPRRVDPAEAAAIAAAFRRKCEVVGVFVNPELDGKKVSGMEELVNVVNGKKPGDEIEVTLLRGGDEKTVTVKLGNRPASIE